MATDTNQMTIVDDNGNEKEVDIILTFDDDNRNRRYVFFTDPVDEEGNVYVYSYDEDGNMNEVTDEEEWNMCQEVLGAFIDEEDNDVSGE